jgi:aminoglycoside phosphotransferase (APT) family kinase protein
MRLGASPDDVCQDRTVTTPEPTRGCQVTFLIPHPTRAAVLVGDDATLAGPTASARVRMPTLWLDEEQPLVSRILDSTELVDSSTAVVLRQLIISGPAEGDDEEEGQQAGFSLLVELDARTDEAPAGRSWQDLDEGVIARLEPELVRDTVGAWLQERTGGWSPWRPPWGRPGWFARASAWMVEQMANDGSSAVAAPRQHQLWGLSVVLRAPSAVGDVYFKASAEIFRHEAVVTRALAAQMPDLTPQVIAVDASRGWLLMRDLEDAELGQQDQTLWPEGLVALAAIQRQWLGRTDELVELGLPQRSLADLAVHVEEMTEDDALLARMTSDLRHRWLDTAPALVESCRRLDESGPGPTLVHGDFHPWNVTRGSRGVRVFDWTDAAVSHPFVDLATFVFRTRDPSVRRRLVDAWVAAWPDAGSRETVQEAAYLGLVVGALYQVQTYRLLLPTLMEHGAYDGMADGDLAWVERSLTRHQRGLESPS